MIKQKIYWNHGGHNWDKFTFPFKCVLSEWIYSTGTDVPHLTCSFCDCETLKKVVLKELKTSALMTQCKMCIVCIVQTFFSNTNVCKFMYRFIDITQKKPLGDTPLSSSRRTLRWCVMWWVVWRTRSLTPLSCSPPWCTYGLTQASRSVSTALESTSSTIQRNSTSCSLLCVHVCMGVYTTTNITKTLLCKWNCV